MPHKKIFNDKKIPLWSSCSSYFTEKNRENLENEDEKMKLWIDMVFGIAQMGQTATSMNNTYNPKLFFNTYEDKTPDIEATIEEHGNAPQHLFDSFHKKRNPEKKPEKRPLMKIQISCAMEIKATKNRIYFVTDQFVASSEGKIIKSQIPIQAFPDSSATFLIGKEGNVRVLYANKFNNFFTILTLSSRTTKESVYRSYCIR